MSLFKPFKGNRSGLDAVTKKDGNAYFCVDDGSFWIDYINESGVLQRKQTSAADAETLCGMTVEQIIASVDVPDVTTLISNHNSSASAHSDIRTLATNAQQAAEDAQTTADGGVTAAGQAQARADAAYTLAEGKVDSLSDLGITASAAELNYCDGVTSNIQNQLNAKAESSHTQTVATGGTGKTSWTANRLIYPSASTTLSQLAFPTTAGSVLRQGTSGAPYWTSLTDLVTAMGISGGAKIQTGSYTGTGTYPVQLTFDFVPRFLIVGGQYDAYSTSFCFCIICCNPDTSTARGLGFARDNSSNYYIIPLADSSTVSGNTISWRGSNGIKLASGSTPTTSSIDEARRSFNDKNNKYQYVAFG